MARRGWGSVAERDGQFYGRFRLDGSPTMRLLKLPNGLPVRTLKQAESALGRLRKKVEEGDARPARTRARTTFRAWASDYLAAVQITVAASSLRAIGAHLERLAAWLEGLDREPSIDEIQTKHADKFAQFLVTTEGCKPSYASRLVRTLRAAWRYAEDHGDVEDGKVWDEVRLRVEEADDVPWIEPEQLHALYGAVSDGQQALVTVLGETGLRVGEAFALRWQDVDLGDRPSVFVKSGKTTASRRKVPLSPRAVAALGTVQRGAEDDVVFAVRTSQGVREAVRRACRKLGLPILKTHSLRHVAASHLVQAGVPAPTVAAILGHADHGVLVLKLYGRWAPVDAQVAAMDRLEAFRSTQATVRPATRGTSPAGRTTPGTPADQAAPLASASPAAGS